MPRAKKVETKTETKVEKPEVKTPKLEYTLEINVNGLDYKCKAETLKQALTDFVNSPNFPFGAKTRAFLKYSKGNVERHRLYGATESRRVFMMMRNKPSALELMAEKMTREFN